MSKFVEVLHSCPWIISHILLVMFKKCFEKSGIFWNYINQQKTLSELFIQEGQATIEVK